MAQEHSLVGLKMTPCEVEQLDTIVRLSQLGVIPGHRYSDRSDLIRKALHKLIAELVTLMEQEQSVQKMVNRLIHDIREITFAGTSLDE